MLVAMVYWSKPVADEEQLNPEQAEGMLAVVRAWLPWFKAVAEKHGMSLDEYMADFWFGSSDFAF